MEALENIKKHITTLAEEKKTEFEETSSYIFHHPELAFHEHKSQAALCDLLEKNGFEVKRGVGSLDTAFEACYQEINEYSIGLHPILAQQFYRPPDRLDL